MTEEQLKDMLLTVSEAAQSRNLPVQQDAETQEALNVLTEKIPSISPEDLHAALMQQDLPSSPEELEAQYEKVTRARTDSKWAEAAADFLEMCMDNLNEAENSPLDLNPSLHDPER